MSRGAPAQTTSPEIDAASGIDVALVTSSLRRRIGGTERQVVRLANILVEQGYAVAVLSSSETGDDVGLRDDVLWLDWRARPSSVTQDRCDPNPWSPAVIRAPRRVLSALASRFIRVTTKGAPFLVRLLRSLDRVGRFPACVRFGRRMLIDVGRRRWSTKVGRLQAHIDALGPRSVMSFLTWPSVLTAMADWDRPVRFVASYRSDIDREYSDEPMRSFEYLIGVRAEALTANSAGTLSALGDRPEADRSRLRLATNIVALPERAAGDARRFLHLGRFVAEKNTKTTLRAFAEIASGLPSWELHLAGEGPERLLLEWTVDELDLRDRVIFHGFVEDVQGFLGPGGVLLALADYEGTSNSVLEAMAHGIPVILSDASQGQRALVGTSDEDAAGLLVPPRDVAATADAMRRLAEDPALRARLGSSGRRRVASMSWTALQAEWLELLFGDTPP